MTATAHGLSGVSYLPFAAPQSPEWHEQRRAGIGGSDAVTIMGFSAYDTVADLWMLKTGRTQPADKPETEAMFWGRALEDVVAARLEGALQNEVDEGMFLRPTEGTMTNAFRPWMRANLDRLVYLDDSSTPVAGAEIKTTGAWGAKEWDDGVSSTALWQAVHYMAVTGLPRFYFGCLIAGQKFVWRQMERADDLESALIEAEEAFWGCVLNDEPPPLPEHDSHPALTRAAMQRLWSDVDPETVVDLDRAMAEVVAERRDVVKAIKGLEELRDSLDSKVMQAMGNHEVAMIDGSVAATWKSQSAKRLDQSALREEQPDIYAKYVTTKDSRVLRVK